MSILLRSVRRGLRVVGAASVLAMGCAHTGRPPLTDWEQAEDYLRTGQGARAVPLLEAMHARNPKDYEVARSLVEAHDQAGQSAALAQRLQGEVSKNPSAVGHYMRGLALFAATHEATPEGVAEFERALALEPRRAELHYRLGLTYVESEQYEAALAPLRRAAELAPYRRAVQLPLSKVLSKLGDRKGAVAALARVVSLGPTREEVATARALIAAWDPIAKLPEGARGDFERGMHALTQDSPQDALTAFEAVVQTHPDLAFGPALLGLAYQRLDDPGRAVESFRRSIELDPSQALPHLYLGNLYLARSQLDMALESYQKAVALNPLLDEAYLHLGELGWERGDLELARRSFRNLAFLEPDNGLVRWKLAQTLQRQGDFDAAEHELRTAISGNPENLEFRLRLGLLYAEKRQRVANAEEKQRAGFQAQRLLKEVLKSQPDNALAIAALQELNAK